MEEKKAVRIECKGSSAMTLDAMSEFQGELKSLSDANYQKLKNEILNLGFSYTFAIWTDPRGSNFLLDGHQRRRTLLKMREEGYSLPAEFPISEVSAQSYDQAKRKLLGAASQYGKIEDQGLYEYLQQSNIELEEIKQCYRLPEVNIQRFEAEFYDSLVGDASDSLDDLLVGNTNAGESTTFKIKCDTLEELEQIRKIFNVTTKANVTTFLEFMKRI